MSDEQRSKDQKYRAGFIGLVGLPNAGKSTLTNLLVGEKVSIVTPKAQTTRQRVTGLISEPSGQIALVDAPGVIESQQGLNSYLQDEFKEVLAQSDGLLLLLAKDSSNLDLIKKMVGMIKDSGKPWAVLLTKTDLELGDQALLQVVEEIQGQGPPFFSMSLLKPKPAEVKALKEALLQMLPLSPSPLFDSDIYTTQTLRQMAAELVREKAFALLHQEIPYGLAVRILRFVEDEGPVVKIYAEILLAKSNHKAIVVGQGGRMIRQMGMEARRDLEKILGRQVYLDLHVAVKKDWFKNPAVMKELGYVTSAQ